MNAADLARHRTIDLTTIGRRSGDPRRIEIWWFQVNGRFVITGTPGRRDWLANVRSSPEVTVHVGGQDLPGRAFEITDPVFRRTVFSQEETRWYASQAEFDRLVSEAPMIEVIL